MRPVLILVIAALLALPSSMATGASAPAVIEPAPIFAGGGTFVSNGTFFPGTAVYDGTKLQGVPYPIEQGQNVTLINLDYGDIANAHQITSFKRRRSGRPLFQSKRVSFPGEQSLVITANLKPGIYEYFCPIHTGMFGMIEVGT